MFVPWPRPEHRAISVTLIETDRVTQRKLPVLSAWLLANILDLFCRARRVVGQRSTFQRVQKTKLHKLHTRLLLPTLRLQGAVVATFVLLLVFICPLASRRAPKLLLLSVT